jgi:outer membrane protein assembly factor BamA
LHQVRAAPVLLVLVAAAVCGSAADDLRIGIIDFYGLGRVSEREARQALTVREGDTVVLTEEEPAFVAESERRLSTVAGVARVEAR